MQIIRQPSCFSVVSPVIAISHEDLLIDNCVCSTNNDVVLSRGEMIADSVDGLNDSLREYSLSTLHEWCARLILVGAE